MPKSLPISNNPSGRPRSEELTERLHAAIWRLLEAGDYRELTMESIAEEAGVTRTTLYRRYTGRGEAVLGALLVRGAQDLAMMCSSSLTRDLETYFHGLARALSHKNPVGKALRGVLSQALVDDEFALKFEDFLVIRREPVRKRLLSHEEWTDEQIEGVLDALFGPMLYRLLIRGVSVDLERIALLVRVSLLTV
jgi:AcrR family transcriptional regulator